MEESISWSMDLDCLVSQILEKALSNVSHASTKSAGHTRPTLSQSIMHSFHNENYFLIARWVTKSISRIGRICNKCHASPTAVPYLSFSNSTSPTCDNMIYHISTILPSLFRSPNPSSSQILNKSLCVLRISNSVSSSQAN
jgi:hypothetical protein